MAGINATALLVKVNNANLRGVVANQLGQGFELETGRTPAGYLSRTRHLKYPDADMADALRRECSITSTEPAAAGAGRPGYSAGVLPSRSFARFAKPAIHCGWPSIRRDMIASQSGDPGKVIRHWFGSGSRGCAAGGK